MAQNRSEDFVWFLSCLALGVTVGLLYAPASGEETRRRIRGAARERGSRLYERGRELYEAGKEMADEAAEIFESGRRLVED
jgi:gas vesicle protein